MKYTKDNGINNLEVVYYPITKSITIKGIEIKNKNRLLININGNFYNGSKYKNEISKILSDYLEITHILK